MIYKIIMLRLSILVFNQTVCVIVKKGLDKLTIEHCLPVALYLSSHYGP